MARGYFKYESDQARIAQCVDKRSDGCWYWKLGTFRGGRYGSVRVDGKTLLAHRWVYTVLVGPVREGAMLCHHCGVTICCNPRHLYIGDIRTNSEDTTLHGSLRGSKHPRARLNEQSVREIRERYAAGGARYRDLAEQYGVSVGTIAAVVIGRNWPHVPVTHVPSHPRFFGENAPTSKLTARAVRDIRKRHAGGDTQRALARRHGVTVASIRAVLLRQSWAHVE